MMSNKFEPAAQLKRVSEDISLALWGCVVGRPAPNSTPFSVFLNRLKTPGACFNRRGIDAGLTIEIVREAKRSGGPLTVDGAPICIPDKDGQPRPATYADAKASFVCAYAFQFRHGRKTQLKQLEADDCNPLLVFDADHVNDVEATKQTLFAHPACVCAAASLGGDGVFAVMRLDEKFWPRCIDLEKAGDHEQRKGLVRAALAAITAATGVEYDPQCVDITRCRAASFDAAPLIRPYDECAPLPIPAAPLYKTRTPRTPSPSPAQSGSPRAPGRPAAIGGLSLDTPRAWQARIKALAKCAQGGRKAARYGAMIEAWRLHLTTGIDIDLLAAEIRHACEVNGLHNDEKVLAEWGENWSNARAAALEATANLLSLDTLRDILATPGGAERIPDNAHIAADQFEVWQALRGALLRDYFPIASDKPAGAVAIASTTARELKTTQWQSLLKRRVFCAKTNKFATFEAATHEYQFCTIRPTVDYARPAGELRVLPDKDGLRVFEINRARAVPALNDAYDKDAWQRAQAIFQWITRRFEHPNEAQWYLSYIAQALCDVKRKPCTAIDLLCTTGGGAKSILATGVTQFIWGFNGAVQNADSETRPGQPFNGSLSEALFIVDDEAPVYRREAIEAYNGLITSPDFPVKRKYCDVDAVVSQHRFFRTSNHERIGYNGGTERRCAVFRIPAPDTSLATDMYFLEYIAPYIGLVDPKDPARRPADYELVRGAFVDLLRLFYRSELYCDVTKPPPASELKDASKYLAILSDKTAMSIAQYFINAKERTANIPRESAAKLAIYLSTEHPINAAEVRQTCKQYRHIFVYNSNGFTLDPAAYRILTANDIDAQRPGADEWDALANWRPPYDGDIFDDGPAPDFNERNIRAAGPKIYNAVDDVFDLALRPNFIDPETNERRPYTVDDLRKEVPELAQARAAWRGLELPPDIMRAPVDELRKWMIDACACPSFPAAVTRIVGALALDMRLIWQSASTPERAAYFAQYARQLSRAYEHLGRWRDADVMTRLYHAMMQLLPQSKPVTITSAPMPGGPRTRQLSRRGFTP